MSNEANVPKHLQPVDRLETLNEIGRVLSGTLDLGLLYETIYQQVTRVMDTTQFFIALHRPETDSVQLVYHREEGELYLDQQFTHGGSVTSLVIDRGHALLFQDNTEYQSYAEQNGLPEITVGQQDSEAKIWVPLNTGNRTIGAMTVQSPSPRVYGLEDVQTLTVIACQAAIAIENARLYAKSQESVRQTQALLDVARVINSSLDLPTVLDSVLSSVRQVIPFTVAAILLPDLDARALDVVGAKGPLAEERRHTVKVPFGQGITGRVFATGEALNVGDTTCWIDYVDHGVASIRSEVAVPLKRGDIVIGVLDVEREEVNSFSDDDLNLLTLFASQAAIAIENARLYSNQQSRVYELQTIQSIVQKLTPLHDGEAIARVINDELKHLIDFHACRIFTVNSDDQRLTPILSAGEHTYQINLKVGEGVAGWVVERGIPVIVCNTLTDDRVSHIPGTPVREESIIGAPLAYQGRVRGVITLSKLGINQFDENAIRLLEIIAAQAAIALDRARLYEELREEAITDALTRLYNRRHLMDRYKEERSRAIRNKHTLTAIMLDIDRFKLVNDTFGHDAGDRVLQELAQMIRNEVRAEDMVARYGGEEFCVLLPEIPIDDALNVAERLRISIASHTMPASAGTRHITVSIGLAVLSHDDPGNELFSRADLAMYQVKRMGGNRVCLSSEDGGSMLPAAELRLASS